MRTSGSTSLSHCESNVGGNCESDAAVEAAVDAPAVLACAVRGL